MLNRVLAAIVTKWPDLVIHEGTRARDVVELTLTVVAEAPTITVTEGASCTPSSGFWYSLFDGGYVRPDELLEEGADEVNAAVEVLLAFQAALEAADAIEEM